jgi:hypothetical protein
MMDHFIVQRNLVNKEDLEAIRSACSDFHIPYTEFTLIPFSDELIYIGPNTVYYGSTTILKHKRPGIFYDDNAFRMSTCLREYGPAMVNHGSRFMQVSKLKDLAEDSNFYFVKPDQCTKRFIGQVMSPRDLAEWNPPADIADWDGQVMVSNLHNLGDEFRVWIVDGRAVTGSAYIVNDRLSTYEITSDHEVAKYAAHQASLYSPSRVFVMDVCGTPKEMVKDNGPYSIVEINSFNSSGFYAASVKLIIEAIIDAF